MNDTRKKLIELLGVDLSGSDGYEPELIADHLIANGVTFATDNPVGDKWVPTAERMPENFVSVLGYMTDAGEFPPVRECYTVGNAFFFPALGDIHPVSHWMEMSEPPEVEK